MNDNIQRAIIWLADIADSIKMRDGQAAASLYHRFDEADVGRLEKIINFLTELDATRADHATKRPRGNRYGGGRS